MPQVAIVGSCVTRDAVPYFPDTWSLHTYIARQSWASIDRPVSDPVLTEHHFASPFQDRMFHGDLAGNAIERIKEFCHAKDVTDPLVLIDLVDERSGFMQRGLDEIFTRSYETLSTDIYDRLSDDWELHTFGSIIHILHFTEGAAKLKETLEELGVFSRTRVLGVSWAEVDNHGQPTPTSLGMSAQEANEIYQVYYGILSDMGWTVVTPRIDAVAHTQHQWGLAPFHYEKNYYLSMIDAVSASL